MELIIQLIAGAVGGNVAGGLLKNLNQGTLINSIAGIVGGGLGGQILGALTGGAVDPAAAASEVNEPCCACDEAKYEVTFQVRSKL